MLNMKKLIFQRIPQTSVYLLRAMHNVSIEWNIRTFILISIFFSLCTVSGQGTPSFAPDHDALRAKSILSEAINYSKKVSFKAINPARDDVRDSGTLYRYTSPDGFLFVKYEEMLSNGMPAGEFFISNRDGKFLQAKSANHINKINGFSVCNLNYLDYVTDDITEGLGTYLLSSDSYMGIPCYKVTNKLNSLDDGTLSKLQGESIDSFKEKKTKVINGLVVAAVYLIGKDNHLIYSYSLYNAAKRKILSMDLGNVVLEFSLNERFFDLPNQNIKEANSRDQLLSNLGISKLSFWERFFNSFSLVSAKIFTSIFFLITASCIGIVLFVKWQKNKSKISHVK